MWNRRSKIAGISCVFVLLLSGCYGVDLEGETFSCLSESDCAKGYQCRQVEEAQFCLEDDSEDVRICETYCDDFFAKCDTPDTNPYENRQDCLDRCDSISTSGEMGDTSGNTVQCRFYHIGVASQGDARHCPHAWPFAASGGCTGECFRFCRDYENVCGEFADQSDVPEEERDPYPCRRRCREYAHVDPDSLDEPATGDSFECRRSYLDLALDAEEGSDDRQEFCRQARSNPELDPGTRCQ